MSDDKIERFTDRADAYAKARPDYPEAVFDLLFEKRVLWKGAKVADIGSGTGIFTKQLLDHGLEVYGIEPNQDMRRQAEVRITSRMFHSVAGRAEETSLPSQSVDAVTAAQSFHWFEPERSLLEFRRILRPAGHIVLVWNNRLEGGGFNDGYSRIVKEFGKEYDEIKKLKDPKRLFGDLPFDCFSFRHSKHYDWESLRQLPSSVSYLPKEGEKGRIEMIADLKQLFLESQKDGKIEMNYEIVCCYSKKNA